MADLAIMMVMLLLGFLVRVLVEGRHCRSADAARTKEWRADDVIATPTIRGVVPSASLLASATVEIAAAPARITRVGY